MNGNAFLSGGVEPFLTHFDNAHKLLARRIQEVKQAFAAAQEETPETDVAALLAAFRQDLIAHFEDEERGSFDEIVARYPHLAAEAKDIERQHPLLLERLDEIIENAKKGEDVADLARQYAEFREALGRHEAQETALLRRGLNLSD